LHFKRQGAIVWKIERQQEESKDAHVSETELDKIPDWFFDAIISNNSIDMVNLPGQVNNAYEETMAPIFI
jgi:hypothetical protein